MSLVKGRKCLAPRRSTFSKKGMVYCSAHRDPAFAVPRFDQLASRPPSVETPVSPPGGRGALAGYRVAAGGVGDDFVLAALDPKGHPAVDTGLAGSHEFGAGYEVAGSDGGA